MGPDGDRTSVPVSLPPALVEDLDALVEAGVFSSRSDALRYGARLVVRESHEYRRRHAVTDGRATEDVRERLERKHDS